MEVKIGKVKTGSSGHISFPLEIDLMNEKWKDWKNINFSTLIDIIKERSKIKNGTITLRCIDFSYTSWDGKEDK